MDADLHSGNDSVANARIAAARVSAWLVKAAAAMLDVESNRLRSEIAAIRPASRLLITGLVALIGATLLVTLFAIASVTSSSEMLAAHAAQPVAPVGMVSRESYDAIVARPLFWRSRQPATSPVTPAPPIELAVADPQISLKGVLISGNLAKAFVLSAESPAGVWRQKGDEVSGWRVAEILKDRVVLESATGRFVVSMSHSNRR